MIPQHESPSARPRLTAQQHSRLTGARQDLTKARRADLGSLTPAALILLIERLRSRLDDTVHLIEETHD
ncbi:hypothetical protein [Streptomyces sp. NPDC057910]|uniref:hypothetical protein n=1 Tax=Streptomyces sp. NPDC057910 TaxID=3346278 RepID=UPI0036F0709B